MNTPEVQSTPASGSNWKIIVGLVVVLAIAALVYFGSGANDSAAPASPETTSGTQTETAPAVTQDTTTDIQQNLNSIDTGNLDADLKSIDDQLKGL